jgi:hypothetical protein
MALPWSAPGYGQGIFPSQAKFFIPETVDPKLLALIAAQRQQNQQDISGSIQGALAGLGKLVEQHRQDAIASQLLAGSAPQATAVGGAAPAAQPAAAEDQVYAQRGLDLSPTGQPIAPATPPASLAAFKPVGAGVPSTALSAAEAAQNRALGFPTQQLMRPSEIYSAREHLYDQSLSDAYKRAQIAHLMTGGGRYGSSNVITDPKTGQPMTLHDYFRTTHPELEKQTPDPWAGAITKRRGWIDEDGAFTTTPPKGFEGMKADEGPYAEVQFPKQKTPVVVPFGAIPPKGGAGGGGGVGQSRGGYVAGQRYGGRLYHGGDPFDEKNWD